MKNLFIIGLTLIFCTAGIAQDSTYKKRVLENVEVDILTSFYSQDGKNAAVTGGIGTEELTDVAAAIVISVPMNDDDVLTIDAGISAYTSASSSNINPFDGPGEADPYQASSGASSGGSWVNVNGIYSHSSDDRNNIISGKLSFATEFDYTSLGFGGSYTRLLNEKNTELSVTANVFLDSWKTIYPYELRPFGEGGNGASDPLFWKYPITGNPDYNPSFTAFTNTSRNSYSIGLGFSQVLSKKLQLALMVDLVQQEGLLSTPFQRVYFKDVEDSFIQKFHLADDVERLPNTRFKMAFGARLNYYLNERIVIRTYYRYFTDDWSINSHTASIEIPVKITDKFTLYPSYRYYMQTAANYFAPYNEHLSTEEFYTSDYDLSEFNAHQYGLGVSYTDIFTKMHIWKFGIKSLDLEFNQYQRNSGLKAFIITAGASFVLDY